MCSAPIPAAGNVWADLSIFGAARESLNDTAAVDAEMVILLCALPGGERHQGTYAGAAGSSSAAMKIISR